MVNVLENFRFRHFVVEADIPRLMQLLTEVEAIDASGEDISEETLREQLTWPGHDPLLDRWIVEAPNNPNEVIGFSSIWKSTAANHADTYVAVHPVWRKQGIGSELMRRTLARAKELDALYAFVYADVVHQGVNIFVRKRGFQPVAAYKEMHVSANIPLATPAWPEGYYVRDYSAIQDVQMLMHVMLHSFHDLWGHRDFTEEEFQGYLASGPLDGIFIVFSSKGEAVGVGKAMINEQLSAKYGRPIGYIDSPGVVPEHRVKQLHLPLLLTLMHWLQAREPTDIVLETWGDAEQTITLYESVGFRTAREATLYKHDLP